MPAYLCSATDLQSRVSAQGFSLRVDDDAASVTQILQRSRNRMLMYCLPEYDETHLLNDANAGGWVNDRATDLATYFLCGRRANPRQDSVKQDYEEAIKELEAVQGDLYQIPNVEQRHTSAPALSNLRIEPGFAFRKQRVEVTISSQDTPIGYGQAVDLLSMFSFEY